MKNLCSVVFILFWSTTGLLSQTFSIVEDSPEMSITGTSTLHDWTVNAEQINDYPIVIQLDDDELLIDSFSFNVEVSSMDGGRGPAMNNKIKKALLAETNPVVSFTQDESMSLTLSSDEEASFTTTGSLDIAGQSKSVEVECTVLLSDDSISFSGSRSLKMTDFGIAPPTAMFGQIKTNDDIVVHFTFTYQKSK